MALEADGQADKPLSDLVSSALERRSALGRAGDTVARLGDSLAYDVILIRLCQRVGIEEDLTADTAGPATRRRIEEALAERVPSMAEALTKG